MEMAPWGTNPFHSRTPDGYLGILHQRGTSMPAPQSLAESGMSLREHYTQVRFGSQVALPHRFARPIHRMYSKWYKPLAVQPKFTRRGKHFTFQPSPPGTCTTLDRRSTEAPFHCQTSFADRSRFAGVPPPRCVLASTPFFRFIPIVPPWFNGSPGFSRGALPLAVVKPQSTPPLQMPVCSLVGDQGWSL